MQTGIVDEKFPLRSKSRAGEGGQVQIGAAERGPKGGGCSRIFPPMYNPLHCLTLLFSRL
jgi:hypothetical protein